MIRFTPMAAGLGGKAKRRRQMKSIEKSKAVEITKLHNEIAGHLRTSLEKAIKIGELLAEQKENLKHGEFTPWVKEHLPFTDRTARSYMRLHREKDRLKTETVSDLTSAYRLLAAPKLEMDIESLKCEFEQAYSVKDPILSEVGFERASQSMMKVTERWRRGLDDPELSLAESVIIYREADELQRFLTGKDFEVERKLGSVLHEMKALGAIV